MKQKTRMDYARSIDECGPLAVSTDVLQAVSLIDISKTAREASGNEIADHYLNRARTLLLALIGIEP